MTTTTTTTAKNIARVTSAREHARARIRAVLATVAPQLARLGDNNDVTRSFARSLACLPTGVESGMYSYVGNGKMGVTADGATYIDESATATPAAADRAMGEARALVRVLTDAIEIHMAGHTAEAEALAAQYDASAQ